MGVSASEWRAGYQAALRRATPPAPVRAEAKPDPFHAVMGELLAGLWVREYTPRPPAPSPPYPPIRAGRAFVEPTREPAPPGPPTVAGFGIALDAPLPASTVSEPLRGGCHSSPLYGRLYQLWNLRRLLRGKR